MFGKPGRPPEDRLERRREIWAAVSPLIEKAGARNLTMRQAAAVSFLSLGGLYHYFPDKRSLVLFGLDQDIRNRFKFAVGKHVAADEVPPDRHRPDRAARDVVVEKDAARLEQPVDAAEILG